MAAPTIADQVVITGTDDPEDAVLGGLEIAAGTALMETFNKIEGPKSGETYPHGASSAGMAVRKAADALAQSTKLRLGTAALSKDVDFASAAQGGLANTVAQSDAVAEIAQSRGEQAAFHFDDGAPPEPHTANFATADPISNGMEFTGQNNRTILRFDGDGGLEPNVAPSPMPCVTGGMVFAENQAIVSLNSDTAANLVPC